MQKYEARVPYTIHIHPPYTWSNTWEQVNRQDLKSVIVTIKKTIECWRFLTLFVELVCGVLLLYSNIYWNNNIVANTQTSAPSAPSSNATDTGRPTIQITSLGDDQQVRPAQVNFQYREYLQTMRIMTARFLLM
jgi:hypothetical protein